MDTGALTEEGIGGGSCSLSALRPPAQVDGHISGDGRARETCDDGGGVIGRAEIEGAIASRCGDGARGGRSSNSTVFASESNEDDLDAGGARNLSLPTFISKLTDDELDSAGLPVGLPSPIHDVEADGLGAGDVAGDRRGEGRGNN